MGSAPVFEEKNSLPGAELHFSIDNRHRLARARQHHANVRSAVVRALSRMHEVMGVLRHEPLEKFFEIFSGRRIGVFHHNKTAAGVLNENCDDPVAYAGLVDLRLHVTGDFVGAFAVGANIELVLMSLHKLRDPENNIGRRVSRALIFRPASA